MYKYTFFIFTYIHLNDATTALELRKKNSTSGPTWGGRKGNLVWCHDGGVVWAHMMGFQNDNNGYVYVCKHIYIYVLFIHI